MKEQKQVILSEGYQPQPKDILSGRTRESFNHGMYLPYQLHLDGERLTVFGLLSSKTSQKATEISVS